MFEKRKLMVLQAEKLRTKMDLILVGQEGIIKTVPSGKVKEYLELNRQWSNIQYELRK